ncbi:MAG: glycoside hydrolase family 88 protein [candidate division KSB1 bacterium]|nr:glycoside hydrolase family 88 protein [candidate division KSB1 bacterium]
MGWYAIALVDVIEILPREYEQREELIDILARLAEAIKKTQDKESGAWWQIMDKPKEPGNYLETSASCMFTYALAKGVRKKDIWTTLFTRWQTRLIKELSSSLSVKILTEH